MEKIKMTRCEKINALFTLAFCNSDKSISNIASDAGDNTSDTLNRIRIDRNDLIWFEIWLSNVHTIINSGDDYNEKVKKFYKLF
jgi:hypothetical protein